MLYPFDAKYYISEIKETPVKTRSVTRVPSVFGCIRVLIKGVSWIPLLLYSYVPYSYHQIVYSLIYILYSGGKGNKYINLYSICDRVMVYSQRFRREALQRKCCGKLYFGHADISNMKCITHRCVYRSNLGNLRYQKMFGSNSTDDTKLTLVKNRYCWVRTSYYFAVACNGLYNVV